jgi:hypothetical protein
MPSYSLVKSLAYPASPCETRMTFNFRCNLWTTYFYCYLVFFHILVFSFFTTYNKSHVIVCTEAGKLAILEYLSFRLISGRVHFCWKLFEMLLGRNSVDKLFSAAQHTHKHMLQNFENWLITNSKWNLRMLVPTSLLWGIL